MKRTAAEKRIMPIINRCPGLVVGVATVSSGPPPGGAKMWIETIIMPREESEPYVPAAERDRRNVLKAAAHEGRALRDAVLGFLDTNQLSGAVKWMSEPGFLPIITVHCTDLALSKLREAADFVVGCAAPIDAYPALVRPQPHLAPEAMLPAVSTLLEPRL
ncbi:hypothetical protein [Pyxidicoccus parkwayensis]|nr:hypothetical protein [Pyxidicoccus parkwaysis]